jgi:hypothetical protein
LTAAAAAAAAGTATARVRPVLLLKLLLLVMQLLAGRQHWSLICLINVWLCSGGSGPCFGFEVLRVIALTPEVRLILVSRPNCCRNTESKVQDTAHGLLVEQRQCLAGRLVEPTLSYSPTWCLCRLFDIWCMLLLLLLL